MTRTLVTKISVAFAAVLLFCPGCSKKDGTPGKITIGLAKFVQHPALDAVEQGIIDELAVRGVDAVYDRQNANGDVNTSNQIANKYKAEKTAVAVGIATPVAVALANTIKDSPVVFATVTDPVSAGLVSDVARGEKNVTGSSDAIPVYDHLVMFKEAAGITTLGYIYTSSEDNSIASLQSVRAACAALGLPLVEQAISNSSEVKQAAESIINRVDGIYITNDNTLFSALPALVQVFERDRKPIFAADVTGAMNGGVFMASGFNYYKAGRATGAIVADILDGKKPAEIPVRFMTDPSDTDMLIDLDAARNCGITVPEKYISAANMIFENGALKN